MTETWHGFSIEIWEENEWNVSNTHLESGKGIVAGSEGDDILAGFQDGEGLEMALTHWPSLLWELCSHKLRIGNPEPDEVVVGRGIAAAAGDEEDPLVHRLVGLEVVQSDGRHDCATNWD
jgi:hypothetical protein